jgi:hypothetical protein
VSARRAGDLMRHHIADARSVWLVALTKRQSTVSAGGPPLALAANEESPLDGPAGMRGGRSLPGKVLAGPNDVALGSMSADDLGNLRSLRDLHRREKTLTRQAHKDLSKDLRTATMAEGLP